MGSHLCQEPQLSLTGVPREHQPWERSPQTFLADFSHTHTDGPGTHAHTHTHTHVHLQLVHTYTFFDVWRTHRRHCVETQPPTHRYMCISTPKPISSCLRYTCTQILLSTQTPRFSRGRPDAQQTLPFYDACSARGPAAWEARKCPRPLVCL